MRAKQSARELLATLQTEKAWLAQVRQLARLLGWVDYHPLVSAGSPAGWPDLVLVRPPRLVVAELKSERGRLTPAQDRWLDLLARCDGIEVYTWRPSEVDEVESVLGREPLGLTHPARQRA